MDSFPSAGRIRLPRIRRAFALAILPLATAAACVVPTDPPLGDDLLWEFPTPGGSPLSIVGDAAGRPYAYVALKEGGLLVLRTDASSAEEAARLMNGGSFAGLGPTTLAQSGNHLFVGLGDFFAAAGSRAGLAVVDVQDPDAPEVRALWVSPTVMSGTTALLVDGSYVYLAAKRHGVLVFDVTAGDTTRLIGSILPDPDFPKANPSSTEHPNARGFAKMGNRLLLANDAGGLRVLDVSNPASPQEVAMYINQGLANKPQAYNAVLLNGTTAYVTLDYCGLEILDVSNPLAIDQLGWWNPWGCDLGSNLWVNSAGHTNQLAFDATRRLVYMSAGASELVVVDVANPASPVLRDQFERANDQAAWGLDVTPTVTYLAYINALIPYTGRWAGVRAVRTPS
jgi:hypothetical protein